MSDSLSEEKINPIVLDLGINRRGDIEEGVLLQMGSTIQYILKRMFAPGQTGGFFKVKGSNSEIESFMKALGAERSYMKSFMKNGLNDPTTLAYRGKLKRATSNFERETGLKWPFK